MKFKKFFGDKRFYLTLAAVVLPIMAQNGITQFVGLLDNLMVGSLGTEEMNGVSIVNQILLVFNLCLFGGMSGIGIFTAQFYGKGDAEGVRHTVRFKLYIAVGVCAVASVILLLFGDTFINAFIHESESEGDMLKTLQYGLEYLRIIMISFIPWAITFVYSSTLRETGNTLLPMISSMCAVATNVTFNYLLIFGKLGFPQLGVAGAAYATLISRIVEMSIVITVPIIKKNQYFAGVYRGFSIPGKLIGKICINGLPLLLNELFWSLGVTLFAQCCSTRGLDAEAAYNISHTVSNLFHVVFISMGNATAILLGKQLGAGDIEGAKRDCVKFAFVSFVLSAAVGWCMAACSLFIPNLYDANATVRQLATYMIIVDGLWMPVNSVANSCYFTLRSGGKIWITILFDSCFQCGVIVPLAFILSRCTGLTLIPLYICCLAPEILKCVVGTVLIKQGKWARNLVAENLT